jgi:uncharacterized membrane protein YeaQ/YmgE (transglycosylase-associated protein family)
MFLFFFDNYFAKSFFLLTFAATDIHFTKQYQIMTGFIGSLIIGGLAGFLAGKLVKGEGYGCIVNVLLGLFGGALCGWLFSLLGIPEWGGILGQIGTGTIGAVIIVYVASLLRK